MPHRRLFRLSGAAIAICLASTVASPPGFCQDPKKPDKQSGESNKSASPQDSADKPKWQLARTPNRGGGPATVSVTKITEDADTDIAGLMLRCGEGADTAVLVVLNKPLGLRVHPKVTVTAGSMTSDFIASVAAPGTLVLLPEKASALIEKAWQAVPVLAVTIADDRRPLHGEIPVDDLGAALQTLQSNCAK